MTALTLTPKHWYSLDFLATDEARTLVDFRLSVWREKGVLRIDGVDYRVTRESGWGDFLLERAGSVLARATKPSAFTRTVVLRFNQRSYTLRARSAFGRTYVLLDGTAEIGSITPDSIWTRRAQVTLPEDWPLPVKAFAMWLTIIHWHRDAS